MKMFFLMTKKKLDIKLHEENTEGSYSLISNKNCKIISNCKYTCSVKEENSKR